MANRSMTAGDAQRARAAQDERDRFEGYVLSELRRQSTGSAGAAVAAHEADPDPHPQYTTAAELAAALAALVDSSPATLDTLNELAAALGDDPNFAATMTAALAGKQASNTTGSFSPTVVGSTTAGVGTYTTQSGQYTRSGDIVHFRLTVTITAHTGTGNIRIGGLPFAAVAGFNAPVAIGQCDNLAFPAGSRLVAEVVAGSSQIRVLSVPSAGAGVSAGVAMDTAFTLTLAGSYHV